MSSHSEGQALSPCSFREQLSNCPATAAGSWTACHHQHQHKTQYPLAPIDSPRRHHTSLPKIDCRSHASTLFSRLYCPVPLRCFNKISMPTRYVHNDNWQNPETRQTKHQATLYSGDLVSKKQVGSAVTSIECARQCARREVIEGQQNESVASQQPLQNGFLASTQKSIDTHDRTEQRLTSTVGDIKAERERRKDDVIQRRKPGEFEDIR